MDAVLKTPERIYVLEFKLSGSASEALQQIKRKKCAERFLADERPVTLVGVSFDQQTRNLREWLIAPVGS